MANQETKKCARPGCECDAREGSKFCGAYCEGAGDTLEVMCACGHAGCTSQA